MICNLEKSGYDLSRLQQMCGELLEQDLELQVQIKVGLRQCRETLLKRSFLPVIALFVLFAFGVLATVIGDHLVAFPSFVGFGIISCIQLDNVKKYIHSREEVMIKTSQAVAWCAINKLGYKP